MRKKLLIATLTIFTALSLTACSEQDVDKAVQKVGEVIEDNKISQEQLDSAEDTYNTVMDKASDIVNEAKDVILEEVEKSTEETEESTEEETTVEGENSSANAGNVDIKFDVEKAKAAKNTDVTVAESSIAEPTVLASNNSDFSTRDLFYITNCMEDIDAYVNVVRQSEIDSLNYVGHHMGIDLRKASANRAYLYALDALSKIDFEDISVSFDLINKYNEDEEEFTKALVEILANQ